MDKKNVRIRLFKDNSRYKGDLFVSVNGVSYKIRRGVEVEVPPEVAEVLEHSQVQDERTAARIAAAEKIAWYLATWTMHFTVKYPADSMLGKMGWDTFGLTSVSTAHQALDQYALRDVQSFLRLYALTGRVQWRERAVAFWCAACQCISDGTMYVNGRLRPAGAQDEAIFHTRWGRHGVEPFRPSQWLPAWPCAFRLENLRQMSDWSVLDAGLERIEGKK